MSDDDILYVLFDVIIAGSDTTASTIAAMIFCFYQVRSDRASYCTALHCTVLYFTVLNCTVTYCTARYCAAPHCSMLYCSVLFCTAL
eukprot:3537652-Pyramimonas_sp.AAC.1